MSAYITESDADAYFATQKLFADAWDDATSAKKVIALQMATSLMEQLAYSGEVTTEGQELQFPRGGDTDIPLDIQYACAENAYSLLDGVDVEYEYDNLRRVSQGFANVRSSHDTAMLPEHKLAGIPSYIAWRLMVPYLRDKSAITLMRIS
jgi:hypothetical protein